MVGFDMDNTLAQYYKDRFEGLAFEETLKKFVEAGYPEELSTLTFNPTLISRGLLVDRKRGNVLKVDAHKYVKVAYHGYQKLTKEERFDVYNNRSFQATDFLSVDTIFDLSEVQLFVEIVEYIRLNPGKIKKSFEEIYQDIREYIDLSHRDGSIKDKVLQNPERYIIKDKYLASTLVRLIDGDKKLFLLTNSDYLYTNAIMSYLLEDSHLEFSSWKDYWDWIFVSSKKPTFFFGSEEFKEVDEKSGKLLRSSKKIDLGKVYSGGNAEVFESLAGYKGDEILFVGDHIYGDSITSKIFKNWRTLLVVPELDEEMNKMKLQKLLTQEINNRIFEKEKLDEELQVLRSRLSSNKRKLTHYQNNKKKKSIMALETLIKQLEEDFSKKKKELESTHKILKKDLKEREGYVHYLWGELMKSGLERSWFAKQLMHHVCLYTSKVTNIRFYSPYKSFMSFEGLMPHDL